MAVQQGKVLFNPLNVDLREPQWKRLIQKLDMVSYHCSMPLLENVQVALMEVLEVRGQPLREDELWGLLCQGVEAIQDLLLTGRAYKDGMPQNLVTPQTLLCTSRGRIMLAPCSYDNVKGTNFCPPDILVNDNSAEIEVEKMYVYTLGQTLQFASNFYSEENDNKPSILPQLSPLLTTVIKAMCQIDIDLRMSIGDILQICSEHAARFTRGVPFSFFIARFHQEVMGSLPETDILSQVEKEVAMENEKSKNDSKVEELIESDLSDDDPTDKSHFYGHRIAYKPASKHKKMEKLNPAPKVPIAPRLKWKTAIEKVKVQNRQKKIWQREMGEIQEGWKQHKAQKSIQRVYEELVERRRMLELLRLSINIGPSMPMNVDTDSALTKGMKPKTLADLVLLLHQPPKGTMSKSNSVDQGDGVNNNPSGSTISKGLSCSDSNVPRLVRMSSSGSNTSSPQRVSLRRKHLSFQTKAKHLYYSLDSIDFNKSAKKRKTKQFVGPEFILASLKPMEPLNICPSKESMTDQSSPQHITVVMLNGRRLDVTCLPQIHGRHLFHSVTQHFMLPEHYLYGLAVLKDGEFLYIDSHQRLSKVAPPGWPAASESKSSTESKFEAPAEVFKIYLRFKFYVDDVNLIRHHVVRHMFYLQLRKDILEERMWCDLNTAIALAGFALQAEFGDYSEEIYSRNYFLIEHYLPKRILKQLSWEDAKKKIHESHCLHSGLSEELAELEYIQAVQKLPEYGHHFYKTYQNKRDPYSGVWLTVSASGIKIFEKKGDDRRVCQEYPWSEIWRISFTRRYFCLMPKTENLLGRHVKYKFYVSEPLKGRYLFHLAMSHHKFFSKLKLRVKVSEIFMEDFELGVFSCDELSADNMEDDENESSSKATDDYSTKLSWKPSKLLQLPVSSLSNLSSAYRVKPKVLGTRVKELATTVPRKIREHIEHLRDLGSQDNARAAATGNQASNNFSEQDTKDDLSSNESDTSSIAGDSIGSHPEGKCELDSKDPPVIDVHLVKDETMGLGLLLTCADNVIDGAYVESVIEGSPAYNSRALSQGDQILSVNGLWVENWSYLDVVDLIKRSPLEVKLKVAKKSICSVKPYLCQSEKDVIIKNDYQEICPSENNNQGNNIYHNSNNLNTIASEVDPNSNVIKTNGDGQNRIPPPVPKRKKRTESLNHKERKYQITEITHEEVKKDGCDHENYNTSLNTSITNCKALSSHKDTSTSSLISPEGIFHVDLCKMNNSLGLRIMSGDSYFPESEGVYVQSLIEGGVAALDGRIQAGDRILEINGICLDGIDYSEVVKTIRELPTDVHLVLYRGLPHPCVVDLEETGEQLSSPLTEPNAVDCSTELHPTNCEETDSSLKLCVKSNGDNFPQEPPSVPPHLSEAPERTLQCNNNNNNIQAQKPVDSECDSETKTVPPPVPPRRSSGMQKLRPKSVFAPASDLEPSQNQRITQRPKISVLELNSSVVSSAIRDAIDVRSRKSNLEIPIIHSSYCPSAKLRNYPPSPAREKDRGINQQNELAEKKWESTSASSGVSSQVHKAVNGLHHKNVINNLGSVNGKKTESKLSKLKDMADVWNYINRDNTLEVNLVKSSRGLGLGVYGGYDPSNVDPAQHLIRIRKLYPLQPANDCGELLIGDVIVSVNGKIMIGLTHTEALDTLRTAPTEVVLKIFRPPPSLIPPLTSYISLDSPSGSMLLASPSASAANTLSKKNFSSEFSSLSDIGEFEVTLVKREGSLGFTIIRRDYQEGSPPPGLYIKSLVRDPAVSDGRLQPGDQILQVNGVDVSGLSHAEAITFLRNTPAAVTLRLCRHTEEPLSPLSLDEKPHVVKPLRKEAMILLTDKRDSPKRRKERRRKSGSSTGSSSTVSSGDSVSSEKESNASAAESDKSADVVDQMDKGLQRNLRPRSLDILGTSQKRNELSVLCAKDDDSSSFFRQASVTGAMLSYNTNKKTKSEMESSEKEANNGGLMKWRGRRLLENDADKENGNQELNDSSESLDDFEGYENNNFSGQYQDDAMSQYHSPMKEKQPVEKTFPVEMDRGWHGRLGFGISDESPISYPQGIPDLCGPFVKAVYPGSLAEADGRIKAGDRLIQVNGEDVVNKPAKEVIDTLRKTRGKIRMIFSRIE